MDKAIKDAYMCVDDDGRLRADAFLEAEARAARTHTRTHALAHAHTSAPAPASAPASAPAAESDAAACTLDPSLPVLDAHDPMRSLLMRHLLAHRVCEAAAVLATHAGACIDARLDVVNDVLGTVLSNIAESYDRQGVTGREKPAFDFARSLWEYMTDEQRYNPLMLCTFLIAGCKFNREEFVAWALQLLATLAHDAVDLTALAVDRLYDNNQLKHSALYYVCKNGSVSMYDMLARVIRASPVLAEARVYERSVAAALTSGQRPPQPMQPNLAARSSSSLGSSEDGSGRHHASDVSNVSGLEGDSVKRPGQLDTPGLYVALRCRHYALVQHVIASCVTPQDAHRVLRCVVVNALLPLDDCDAAHALVTLCRRARPVPLSASPSDSAPSADGLMQVGASAPGGDAAHRARSGTSSTASSSTSLLERYPGEVLLPALVHAGPDGAATEECEVTTPPVWSASDDFLAAVFALARERGDGVPASSSSGAVHPVDAAATAHPTMVERRHSAQHASPAAGWAPGASAYHGAHMCMFLHESCAEPYLVRQPPARRYFTWLLRHFRPACLCTLPRMRWAGVLASSTADRGAPTDITPLHDANTTGFVPAALPGTPAPAPSAGTPSVVWQDWTPMHSAAAAACADLCARLLEVDRPSVHAAAARVRGGGPHAATALSAQWLHPIRVAVEASYWLKRFDAVMVLLSHCTQLQLDVELYQPCKHLYHQREQFVKTLCKAAPVSLRFMRHGGSQAAQPAAFTASPLATAPAALHVLGAAVHTDTLGSSPAGIPAQREAFSGSEGTTHSPGAAEARAAPASPLRTRGETEAHDRDEQDATNAGSAARRRHKKRRTKTASAAATLGGDASNDASAPHRTSVGSVPTDAGVGADARPRVFDPTRSRSHTASTGSSFVGEEGDGDMLLTPGEAMATAAAPTSDAEPTVAHQDAARVGDSQAVASVDTRAPLRAPESSAPQMLVPASAHRASAAARKDARAVRFRPRSESPKSPRHALPARSIGLNVDVHARDRTPSVTSQVRSANDTDASSADPGTLRTHSGSVTPGARVRARSEGMSAADLALLDAVAVNADAVRLSRVTSACSMALADVGPAVLDSQHAVALLRSAAAVELGSGGMVYADGVVILRTGSEPMGVSHDVEDGTFTTVTSRRARQRGMTANSQQQLEASRPGGVLAADARTGSPRLVAKADVVRSPMTSPARPDMSIGSTGDMLFNRRLQLDSAPSVTAASPPVSKVMSMAAPVLPAASPPPRAAVAVVRLPWNAETPAAHPPTSTPAPPSQELLCAWSGASIHPDEASLALEPRVPVVSPLLMRMAAPADAPRSTAPRTPLASSEDHETVAAPMHVRVQQHDTEMPAWMRVDACVAASSPGCTTWYGRLHERDVVLKRFDSAVLPIPSTTLGVLAALSTGLSLNPTAQGHTALSSDIVAGRAHVLPVLSTWVHAGASYVFSERLDSSLDAALAHDANAAGGTRVPLSVRVRQAHELASGVAYMHACGVPHGALHPHNVLMHHDQPFVCDVGMLHARLLHAPPVLQRDMARVQRALHGEWMPAEMHAALEGLTKHARDFSASREPRMNVGMQFSVDVFAFGCLLLYLLTSGANHPFGAPTLRVHNILDRHHLAGPALRSAVLHEAVLETQYDRAAFLLAPAEALDSLGSLSAFVVDAVRACVRLSAEERPSMSVILQHPIFWSLRDCIDFVADFADDVKRVYGVAPVVAPDLLPTFPAADTSPSAAAAVADLHRWRACGHADIVYLEHAFAWHEGAGSDWSMLLQARDPQRRQRTWRTTGATTAAAASTAPAMAEEHKSPENYFWTYRKRGLYAVGIIRAIRNICFSHASDYVADGTFTSVEEVWRYFLCAFPWLVLEIRSARAFAGRDSGLATTGRVSARAALLPCA